MPWGNDLGQGGWASRGTTPQGLEAHLYCAHSASAITHGVVGLGAPVARGLARTGRRDGGWVCSEFQMAEDLTDHLALRDDSDEPQRPLMAPRAGGHLQVKAPPQKPAPRPIGGTPWRLLRVHPLLAWGGDDAAAEVAVRRQTAPIAHQMDMW